MQIQILGSGGFLPTPRAKCYCRICKKARQNGFPYQRRGPALYLKNIDAIFDTPEDINESLNFSKVKDIKNIFYTHWHPDHTLGYRIVEILREQEFFKNKFKPVNIYIPAYDWANFKKFIPGLWYFESTGQVKIKKLSPKGIKMNKVEIKPIRLTNSTFSAYLIKQKNKKIILCPDHSRDLPIKDEYKDADLFIINMGFFADNLRGLKKLSKNHRVFKVCTGFEKDNLRVISKLKPKQTILMHIEEKYNRSNDEFLVLEKKHQDLNIKFAVDGLKIKV